MRDIDDYRLALKAATDEGPPKGGTFFLQLYVQDMWDDVDREYLLGKTYGPSKQRNTFMEQFARYDALWRELFKGTPDVHDLFKQLVVAYANIPEAGLSPMYIQAARSL